MDNAVWGQLHDTACILEALKLLQKEQRTINPTNFSQRIERLIDTYAKEYDRLGEIISADYHKED